MIQLRWLKVGSEDLKLQYAYDESDYVPADGESYESPPLKWKDVCVVEDAGFKPISNLGYHMTFEHWNDCCEGGGFIDYDGFGELATATEVSDITINPSQRETMDIPDWATHVVWYNK